jgi:hypothetical protein
LHFLKTKLPQWNISVEVISNIFWPCHLWFGVAEERKEFGFHWEKRLNPRTFFLNSQDQVSVRDLNQLSRNARRLSYGLVDIKHFSKTGRYMTYVSDHLRLGSSTNASRRKSENNPMALLTKNGIPAPFTIRFPSHGISKD